jgi:hypothetical protein
VSSFDVVLNAWASGKSVQYFVVLDYDPAWTDYDKPHPPTEQPGRLIWRIKPTTGEGAE